MVSTSKTVKYAYVPPGALARGQGKSFRALGSVTINVEQRTSIGKGKNYNAVASDQNKLAQKDCLMPPGFDPILECDASLPHDEAMQDIQRSEITRTIPGDPLRQLRKGLQDGILGDPHGIFGIELHLFILFLYFVQLLLTCIFCLELL